MTFNEAGLKILTSFEGCRLKSYQDQHGVWTCGFGITGKDIGPDTEWTQEEADKELMQFVQVYSKMVEHYVKVELNDNQFSSLVSFSYNVGIGNFAHSGLLRLINEKDFDGAAAEFLRWDKIGPIYVPGLLRRRSAEQALFLTAPA